MTISKMKRATPIPASPDRQYVQHPVSCRLCRSRKLKCDRGKPCFNCSSRNLECVYLSDKQTSGNLKHRESVLGGQQTSSSDGDIIRRLQRLEAAVFPDDRSDSDHHGRGILRNFQGPSHHESASYNQDEEPQKTSKWFETLLIAPSVTSSPGKTGSLINLETFPTYTDGKMLLDLFTTTIDATYRILHRPTTWGWYEDLYADLRTNQTPSATQLAFFLGVFAGAAFVTKKNLRFETAYLNGKTQLALAESWLKQSVILLTEPPVPTSIEALQALTHLSHLCTQIEGFSGMFGTVSMFCVHMAKSMKIHRLDTPRARDERRTNGADMIELEVKRRIWWHMVASDWLLSFIGGPNEGTYMLHPRQMQTSHPSNVEDHAIPAGITKVTEEVYRLPHDQPTSMAYFLCRIQTATLSREVTDSLPLSFFDSPGTTDCDEVYRTIITLDEKYQQLLKALPPFFQLSRSEECEQQLVERPYLRWQRYLINFVIHTHLARLHRPFLIRGSTQHKYAYSRMQCIRSAEIVLAIRDLAAGDQDLGAFTYVLSHFMMAAVILSLDVCFNPNEIRVPQRKQEVLKACRVLEEELNAKLTSYPEADDEDCSKGELMLKSFQRAIQHLRDVLRKQQTKDKMPIPVDNPPVTSSESDVPPSKSSITSPQHQDYLSNLSGADGSASTVKTSQLNNLLNIPEDELPITKSVQDSSLGAIDNMQTDENQGQGELFVDELWNEFFAVGPTFNDTDWDAFLVDLES